MNKVDLKRVEDMIEHTPINEFDTELLDKHLLFNKYDLSKIKPIDFKQVSKINADLFDLNRELDFWISISNFLKNCSYFNTYYVKVVLRTIKKECVEQLNYYIDELEQEVKRIKRVV
jgi:hypothetical protein